MTHLIEKIKTQFEELIASLSNEEDRHLAEAAEACGYLFTAETVEELEDELEDVRADALIGIYPEFSDYAQDIIDDYLADVSGPIQYYFDTDQFTYDLKIETNYDENAGGCFIFQI